MNTMIKPACLIFGTALLLTACAQEDLPRGNDVEDRKIIFHTSLPGVSSRAKEITTDFTYFHLSAFNPADNALIAADGSLGIYINNESIDKVAGQDVLTSDKCIWPEPGKDGNMTFFAYYPSLNDGAQLVNASRISGTETIIDYKITDFRVAPDIADQVDFISADATGSMAENLFSGIALNFEHQLSRIEVNAWGANKSCDIEIAGVRIGGVNVAGTFDFNPAAGTSVWSGQEKGDVEYIYRDGAQIVTLSLKNNTHATSTSAASIMGTMLGSDNNCAMLLPTADATGWNYAKDPHNSEKGMYISVLLRITDAKAVQQYPYKNNNQGLNALNIPVVYLAVDKATGKNVSRRLYKSGNTYYTDEKFTTVYAKPDTEEVKEFGWAALPVKADWEPGYVYTYTLDYTYGVGLHDPGVEDPQSGSDSAFPGPKAGDPIISDRVGITVSVNDWQGLNGRIVKKLC